MHLMNIKLIFQKKKPRQKIKGNKWNFWKKSRSSVKAKILLRIGFDFVLLIKEKEEISQKNNKNKKSIATE